MCVSAHTKEHNATSESDACCIIDIKPTYKRAWRRAQAAAVYSRLPESQPHTPRAASATDEQSRQDERVQPTVARVRVEPVSENAHTCIRDLILITRMSKLQMPKQHSIYWSLLILSNRLPRYVRIVVSYLPVQNTGLKK